MKFNFSRNASNNFFKGKTMKNFINNKFSCGFLSYNLNKISTKNFINFSNAFFLKKIQLTILANKSLSSSAIAKLIIGEESSLENLENSLAVLNENLLEGKFNSEFLIANNSMFFFFFFLTF